MVSVKFLRTALIVGALLAGSTAAVPTSKAPCTSRPSPTPNATVPYPDKQETAPGPAPAYPAPNPSPTSAPTPYPTSSTPSSSPETSPAPSPSSSPSPTPTSSAETPYPTPSPTLQPTSAPTTPEETPPPTPEQTPAPTPAETPEETPAPTPEETPAPTPEETPAPTPEEIPTPTPAETPAPTPQETPAPTPGDTPAPTPEETPAPTPEETPAPTPEETPAPTPEETPAPTPASTSNPVTSCASGRIALRADTGNYVSRCNNCGMNDAYPDSVTMHLSNADAPYSQWIVQDLGSGKVALQSADSQKFLARCNYCHGSETYPDSAFVHVDSPNGAPWSHWTVHALASGHVAFQADTGNYLARCNGCVVGAYPDFAMVHSTNPETTWSNFAVECLSSNPAPTPAPTPEETPAPTPEETYAPTPEEPTPAETPEVTPAPAPSPYTNPLDVCTTGIISLQSDTGAYLTSCLNCGIGDLHPNSATMSGDDADAPSALWIVNPRADGKLGLQNVDTSKYLERCHECHGIEAFDESAFVEANDGNLPHAQWTAVVLGNGKVAFQADTGGYLARCSGCVVGSVDDFAMVHSTDPNEPWAQFTVGCHVV